MQKTIPKVIPYAEEQVSNTSNKVAVEKEALSKDKVAANGWYAIFMSPYHSESLQKENCTYMSAMGNRCRCRLEEVNGKVCAD